MHILKCCSRKQDLLGIFCKLLFRDCIGRSGLVGVGTGTELRVPCGYTVYRCLKNMKNKNITKLHIDFNRVCYFIILTQTKTTKSK